MKRRVRVHDSKKFKTKNMTRQTIPLKQVVLIIYLLTMCVILLTKISFATEDFDALIIEIQKIEKLYNNGQYKKVRIELNKIIKKIGVNKPPLYGMEYPGNIRRSIIELDNLLKDKSGYYDHFPKFTGKIMDWFGNHGGYIIVQNDKEKMSFIFETGCIFKGSGIEIGKRVTVYYSPFGDHEKFYDAYKVITHSELNMFKGKD